MAENRIEIDLIANDAISPALSRIQANTGAFSGTMGSFLGNLGANFALKGVDFAISQVGKLKDSLMDAASLQTRAIGTASDISTKLGVPLEAAQKAYDTLQGKLATSAASLPGSTQDYNAIFDQIAPSVAGIFKGDVDKFSEVSADISTRLGVLAAKTGADAGMGGGAINRAIAGTASFGELTTIDIFQKSPLFVDAIRQNLKALGKTTEDWKDLTSDQRLKIIQDSLKTATPDKLMKALGNTAESYIQGFQTQLFDPRVGLFGMLRKVNGKSAIDAFTGVLGAIDGLSKTATGLLSKYGIGFDPMGALISFFDWLTGVIKSFDGLLKGGKGDFKLDWNKIGDIAVQVQNWLYDWEKKGLKAFTDFIDKVDWNKLGKDLAANVSGAWSVIGRLVWNALQKAPWGEILEALWKAFKALLTFLVSYLLELGKRLLSFLGDQWNKLVDSIGKWFSDGINSAGKAISDFFGKVTQWFKDLVSKIPGVGQNLAANIGQSKATGGLQDVLGGSKALRTTVGDAFTPAPTQGSTPLLSPALSRVLNSNSSQNNNVTVHATTNADANEIGQSVIRALSQNYRQQQQATLGAF